jgi:hypothetical protein
MSRATGIIAGIVTGIVTILCLLAVSAHNSEEFAVDVQHAASLRSCARSVQNQSVNAEAWYTDYVHEQLKADESGNSRSDEQSYRTSAQTYLQTATVLNSHTYGKYSVTWPVGSDTHPLGLGTLNCAALNPLPDVPFINLR